MRATRGALALAAGVRRVWPAARARCAAGGQRGAPTPPPPARRPAAPRRRPPPRHAAPNGEDRLHGRCRPAKAMVFWGKKRLGIIAPHQPLVIQRPRDSGPLDVIVKCRRATSPCRRARTPSPTRKVSVKLTPVDQKNTLLGYREELPPPPMAACRPPAAVRTAAPRTTARARDWRVRAGARPPGSTRACVDARSRIGYQRVRADEETRVLVLFDTDGEPPRVAGLQESRSSPPTRRSSTSPAP